MTDMRAFTLEQVLATPKGAILDAVRRGEGPPVAVMEQIIRDGLEQRLRRIRERS